VCVERVCWLRGWGSVGGGRGVSVCVLHVITACLCACGESKGGKKEKMRDITERRGRV
jgi:hypothetical protein